MSAAQEANVVNLSRYRVKEAHVQRQEYNNTVWQVSVDPSVTFEEVLKPEFWAHVVGPKNMKIGDELKVMPHDNAWWAWLVIRNLGNVWAKVGVLHKIDFDDDAEQPEQPVGFHVVWQGPVNRYVVIRDKDSAVVSKGHKSKSDANMAMLQHVKEVGA